MRRRSKLGGVVVLSLALLSASELSAGTIEILEVVNQISTFAELEGVTDQDSLLSDGNPFIESVESLVTDEQGVNGPFGFSVLQYSSNETYISSNAEVVTRLASESLEGEPWAAESRVLSTTRFRANGADLYDLSVVMDSVNYGLGGVNVFGSGYLYDETTSTFVHQWSLAELGGSGTLDFSGALIEGHVYKLWGETESISGDPDLALANYYTRHKFRFDLATMIPVPSAVFLGFAGLCVIAFPRRRRYSMNMTRIDVV